MSVARFRRGSIAALVIIPTLTLASLGRATDTVRVFGAGANSCGTWTAEIGTGAGVEDRSWALGFVSAYNIYGLSNDGDVARGTNYAGLLGWIDNYCRANPLDDIATAVTKLISVLRARSGAR